MAAAQQELASRLLLDDEKLFALLDVLRAYHFTIGTDQVIRIYRRAPTRLSAYAGFISPIVCLNEFDQQRFQVAFEKWLNDYQHDSKPDQSLITTADKQEKIKFDNPTTKAIKETARKTRIWPFVVLAIAAIAVFVAISDYIIESKSASQEKTGLKDTTQTDIGTVKPEKTPLPENGPEPKKEQPETKDKEPTPSIKELKPVKLGPEPQEVIDEFESLRLSIVGSILLAYLILSAWYIRRNRLWLERNQSQGAVSLHSMHVNVDLNSLCDSQALKTGLKQLRRFQYIQTRKLDVARSVHATVKQGGYFSAVYDLRPMQPEYLILVDQLQVRDYQRLLVDLWIKQLRQEGLHIDVWYFYQDPRICYAEHSNHSLSLHGLSARYSEHRLMLVTDAKGLVHPLSGTVQPWMNLFSNWEDKAIVSPRAGCQWGYREQQLLQHGFAVVPLDTAGFEVLGDNFDETRPENKQSPIALQIDTIRPLPERIATEPDAWLYDHELTAEHFEGLKTDLQNYLGDQGYFLLCACAIYPALEWHLTLYLDQRLSNSDFAATFNNKHEAQHTRLLHLARLPWFRNGFMPDTVRLYLSRSMPKDQEQYIRAVLSELLETALNNEGEGFELDIALSQPKQPQRWLGAFLRNLPNEDALSDEIFVSVIQGRRASRLSLLLPNLLQKLFPRSMQPAKQFFKLALLPACIISLLLAWFIINLTQKPETQYNYVKYLEHLENTSGASRAVAEKIFQQGKSNVPACAACHSANGWGDDAMGTPAINGQNVSNTVKQMEDYATDKRNDSTMYIMNNIAKYLSNVERASLALYLETSGTSFLGSDLAKVKELGSVPVGEPASGRWLYESAETGCVNCHGVNGEGKLSDTTLQERLDRIYLANPDVPVIGRQNYVYLVNRLKKYRDGSRANDGESKMREVAKYLTDDAIYNLAAYLSTIDPDNKQNPIPEHYNSNDVNQKYIKMAKNWESRELSTNELLKQYDEFLQINNIKLLVDKISYRLVNEHEITLKASKDKLEEINQIDADKSSTITDKLVSWKEYKKLGYISKAEEQHAIGKIKYYDNLINTYASIDDADNFLTCRGMKGLDCKNVTYNFPLKNNNANVYVWAKVKVPKNKETINFKFYNLQDNTVVGEYKISVKENMDGYRVYKSQEIKEPGNYQVQLLNSKNELIGVRDFKVE